MRVEGGTEMLAPIETSNEVDINKKKARRRVWIVAALLVVLVGGFSVVKVAASGKAGAKAEKTEAQDGKGRKAPVPVNVAAVETGTVSSYIRSTANLVPDN